LVGGGALLADPAFARGFVLGGSVRLVGFCLAVWAAQVAVQSLDRVNWSFRKWVVVRMLCYALALYKAYTFDIVHLRGFWGAVVGLMVVRLAVTLVGITGWDLKNAE
jgi:hypothetical protein